MSTHPNTIRCPWCGAQPNEVCTVQAGPGARKKMFRKAPLKLTGIHPARIAAAMRLDGAGEGEIERKLAGQLAAATGRYRDQPGCAASWDVPVQGHQDTPERPSAATTAATGSEPAAGSD